ncbi:uncharacterized protein [Oscarella lobularis]|uniref:uncharacterized protein isoform X2 n=1 Tax=Oscarella lobularis TaxID=121494 RepID=UPI0033142DE3
MEESRRKKPVARKAKPRISRTHALPPIGSKSKWGPAGIVTRAGIRLAHMQKAATTLYQIKWPDGDTLVVYVYSKLPGLAEELRTIDLPLDVRNVDPEEKDGVLTEMVQNAVHVLADPNLIAPIVFKMRKLKWLHVTSPVAKPILQYWSKRLDQRSVEHRQERADVEAEIARLDEELARLRVEYRDTLAQTPPSLESARAAVQSLTERFIKDINLTLLDPHESVRQCLEPIIIILKRKWKAYAGKRPTPGRGYDMSWAEICRETTKPNFVEKLQNFDSFAEIDAKFLRHVLDHHMKKLKRRTYQIQLQASPASAMLYKWLDVVVRFASLMVMREPLPAQIREATERLGEAKRRREELDDEARGVARPHFVLTRPGRFFAALVAEFTLSHVFDRERNCRRGWVEGEYRPLDVVSVGILGLGEAGREVARVCKSLGMVVWALVRRPDDESERIATVDRRVTVDQLPTLLKEVDYLVGLLPSTQSTDGLLSGTILAECKEKKPLVLNFGSGFVTDSETIEIAKRENWIKDFVQDSFADERETSKRSPHVTFVEHFKLEDQVDAIAASFGEIAESCLLDGVATPKKVVKFTRGY